MSRNSSDGSGEFGRVCAHGSSVNRGSCNRGGGSVCTRWGAIGGCSDDGGDGSGEVIHC